MKDRILATIILWFMTVFLIWLFGHLGAFIIIAVFGVGSMWELANLMQKANHPINRPVALIVFTALLGALMLIPPWILPPFALIAISLSTAVVACLFRAQVGTFAASVIPTLGAILLLIMLFGSSTLIIHESGVALLLWIVAVTKFGDVGALLTGMTIGKHKMAPRFSPKKTWEGLGGGIVLSVIVSIVFVYFFAKWLPEELTYLNAGWAAAFISLAGVLGDLVESAFKREAKVKDSGHVIPGIGGFLDLSDSMTLAMPVGYFLTWVIF